MSEEPSAEQRRRAERNARFYASGSIPVALVGVLLGVFGATMIWAGAEILLTSVMFVGAAAAFGSALHGLAQQRRRLEVARSGQLAEAIIRKAMRRPGGAKGNPKEYSMLVEPLIPNGEPIWIRARIEPDEAAALFGKSLPKSREVSPKDLRVPVIVFPASPKLILLAC